MCEEKKQEQAAGGSVLRQPLELGQVVLLPPGQEGRQRVLQQPQTDRRGEGEGSGVLGRQQTQKV